MARYVYPARLHSAFDGDTMRFVLDLGFGQRAKVNIRVAGIDTPESRGSSAAEKEAAAAATDFAVDWLTHGTDLEKWPLEVETHGAGKWGGRWLGSITRADGGDYAAAAIAAGHAVEYHGGTKRPWPWTAELPST